MNTTPKSNRLHIAFFGNCNAGKSSVVNAFTNQKLSVVSNVFGTTTDPVSKSMELLPIGPVEIIDTTGFDDNSDLGKLRVEKTFQILRKTDVAILVIDVTKGKNDFDRKLISLFKEKNIPYIIVYNKTDLQKLDKLSNNEIMVSATENIGINDLREKVAHFVKVEDKKIIGDKLNEGDIAILVVPIDKSAPKGRLILPQQQTIRDIIDSNCTAIVCKEDKITETINNLKKKPKVVITDSQVFKKANADTPKDIYLTSFSILMARYEGFLATAVKGAKSISDLNDGDKILIAEFCTHHRQCEDIGTVKLPKWLNNFTNKNIEIDFCSGTESPNDLGKYKLVIHCGGCMLNEREVQSRMNMAIKQHVPFTNYGTSIAYMQGILERSLEIFPEFLEFIKWKVIDIDKS